MSKDIANPLQSLVKRASRTLPATTGKTAAKQVDIDRRAGSVVILADISASMNTPSGCGRRKIDVLRDAVADCKGAARLLVFSAGVREVREIPEPEANTNLAGALSRARELDAGTTLVISDGAPDNESAALASARAFRGAIDVLYIGPDSDTSAIAFMRRLAAAAGGRLSVNDITQRDGALRLERQIAGLLPAP